MEGAKKVFESKGWSPIFQYQLKDGTLSMKKLLGTVDMSEFGNSGSTKYGTLLHRLFSFLLPLDHNICVTFSNGSTKYGTLMHRLFSRLLPFQANASEVVQPLHLPLRYLNSQFNWYHLPQTPAPNEEKWPDLKQCIATLSYFVQTLSHPLNWPQSITWTSDGPCPVNLKITFQNTKFSYGNIFTDQKEIHFKKSSEILLKIDDLAAFVILSRPQFY